MKKRRVKNWVKNAYLIIILGLFTLLVIIGIDNYSKDISKCDYEKGYTCNIFGK